MDPEALCLEDISHHSCACTGSAQAVAAEAVLLDAAAFRRPKPAAVLSALQTLEDLHKAQADVPGKALALLRDLSLITMFRPEHLNIIGPHTLACPIPFWVGWSPSF